jgi:hypothetical protein
MSENNTLSTQLTKLDGFQSIEEMTEWAKVIIDSGLLPNTISEPAQVVTIIQHGKELGLSPHVALNNVNVIQGRPTLSSTIIGALLKRRGIEWIWDEDFEIIKDKEGKAAKTTTGAANRRTTIHFYWKSSITDRVMEATHAVTWAQFEIAGYTTKQNWERFPKEMLRARCLSSAVRALFPEVLSGFYTDIEMAEELTPTGTYNAIINEDGEIQIENK